eukprot:6379139-Amphidinium_carterae.1
MSSSHTPLFEFQREKSHRVRAPSIAQPWQDRPLTDPQLLEYDDHNYSLLRFGTRATKRACNKLWPS